MAELVDGWAVLQQIQPAGEANRSGKTCAYCEKEGASKFCQKCRCTPYCSRECQALHWKAAHSKVCRPDPLVGVLSVPGVKLPELRDYTVQEASEEALFWVMRAGTCADKPVDNRDAHCMLIQQPAASFSMLPAADSGRLGVIDVADVGAVGWTSAVADSEVASGYNSIEDKAYFRVFWERRPPAGTEENRIAHALVLTGSSKYFGNFVVAKVRREAIPSDDDTSYCAGATATDSSTSDGGNEASLLSLSSLSLPSPPKSTPQAMPVASDGRFREVPVPFTKPELVDACVWRWFCGAPPPRGLGGLTSSRTHRENMRRREMAGFLAKQGFEGGSFQNTSFHSGIEE